MANRKSDPVPSGWRVDCHFPRRHVPFLATTQALGLACALAIVSMYDSNPEASTLSATAFRVAEKLYQLHYEEPGEGQIAAVAYTLPKHPGFTLVPGAIPVADQVELIKAVLQEYPDWPASTNHTVEYGPVVGIWSAAEHPDGLRFTSAKGRHEEGEGLTYDGGPLVVNEKPAGLVRSADTPTTHYSEAQGGVQIQSQRELGQAAVDVEMKAESGGDGADAAYDVGACCQNGGASCRDDGASCHGCGQPCRAEEGCRQEGEGGSQQHGSCAKRHAGETRVDESSSAHEGGTRVDGRSSIHAGETRVDESSSAHEGGTRVDGWSSRHEGEARVDGRSSSHAESIADLPHGPPSAPLQPSSSANLDPALPSYRPSSANLEPRGPPSGSGVSFEGCWSRHGPGPPSATLLRKLRWASLGPRYNWSKREYDMINPHRVQQTTQAHQSYQHPLSTSGSIAQSV
eukprot:gene20081-26796_t